MRLSSIFARRIVDGDGNNGTLNVNSSYTAGTQVAVAEGLTVAFSAGEVESLESFTIDVTPATARTIQAAQDAEIEFGTMSPK